jgi:hypothetical protein
MEGVVDTLVSEGSERESASEACFCAFPRDFCKAMQPSEASMSRRKDERVNSFVTRDYSYPPL